MSTAQDIVQTLGGAGNISGLSHCATRLRFQLRDASGVDVAAVAELEGDHLPAVEVGRAGAQALAASERGLPCLSQRVFPVIGVDGAVSACHLYRDAPLADDYLRADWAALLAARSNCAPCLRCQTHALHRLDVDVLLRRHPEQREALLGNGAGGARG